VGRFPARQNEPAEFDFRSPRADCGLFRSVRSLLRPSRPLTLVRPSVADVRAKPGVNVVHYGDSVSTFLLNLQAADDRGRAGLHLGGGHRGETNLDYNRGNPTGDPAKDGKHLWPAVPLAAVYPKEGRWLPPPLRDSHRPWVTAEKRSGARAFLAYLQQTRPAAPLSRCGFRDLRVFSREGDCAAKGVLPEQPGAYLQLPPGRVISAGTGVLARAP